MYYVIDTYTRYARKLNTPEMHNVCSLLALRVIGTTLDTLDAHIKETQEPTVWPQELMAKLRKLSKDEDPSVSKKTFKLGTSVPPSLSFSFLLELFLFMLVYIFFYYSLMIYLCVCAAEKYTFSTPPSPKLSPASPHPAPLTIPTTPTAIKTPIPLTPPSSRTPTLMRTPSLTPIPPMPLPDEVSRTPILTMNNFGHATNSTNSPTTTITRTSNSTITVTPTATIIRTAAISDSEPSTDSDLE